MTKKIKEQPVTKTELQEAIKYIDVALGGRFKTMETRLSDQSNDLINYIKLLIKEVKRLSIVFIITGIILIVFALK